jgi:hypothetical protein
VDGNWAAHLVDLFQPEDAGFLNPSRFGFETSAIFTPKFKAFKYSI